jgi:hypothetical protein
MSINPKMEKISAEVKVITTMEPYRNTSSTRKNPTSLSGRSVSLDKGPFNG